RIGAVALLGAEADGGDQHLAGLGGAAAGQLEQPFLDRFGERGGVDHIEAQLDAGRDLVDVLPAGAAGAEEAEVQLVLGDGRHGAARRAMTTARSRACRKAERSLGPNGGGPEVATPMERRCSPTIRPARAEPMESGVKGWPLAFSAWAPALRQRSARGMSAVMTMSPGPARSAIQSSAMSGPASTTTCSIQDSRRVLIQPLETTNTFRPQRSATR